MNIKVDNVTKIIKKVKVGAPSVRKVPQGGSCISV